jgi:hypothetical protein
MFDTCGQINYVPGNQLVQIIRPLGSSVQISYVLE